MRDILVTAIVLAAIVYGFRRPWVGVMLWTWLSIMNPHRLTFGFAYDMPFAAMAAGAVFLSLFITRDRIQYPGQAGPNILVMFVMWMTITTIFSVYPEGSFDQLKKVLKIQVMTLVALAVLHERRHIQWFLWINAFSLGFFGVKGGLYTIDSGGSGKVWGPGGFIGGNNEIGLAILCIIPLIFCILLEAKRKWLKVGLAACMLLCAVSVLGTMSRGAFVAIAVMTLVLWWRAPRKLVSGILLALASVLALSVMTDRFVERMETIKTYQEDDSAMGRIHAWRTAVNIANARPLGAGFAMYEASIFDRYAPSRDSYDGQLGAKVFEARAAHSIYFQVLGEHGWIGLLLFLSLWVVTWREAQVIRRRTRGVDELKWAFNLASMCQVSLVGFLVGGAFLSLAYFDLPYNILVLVVVLKRWLVQHQATSAASATSTPLHALGASRGGGA
jgi:putative inorganic carbon (hco3(-)) transporter